MGYLCNDFHTCTKWEDYRKIWYCQLERPGTKVCGGIVRKFHTSKFEILMRKVIKDREGDMNDNL